MWESLAEAAPDASSPLPTHHQVYVALRSKLSGGSVPPGAALPTERALAELLGISRATLRRALSRLEDDGILVRRQGDGTFVAEKSVPQPSENLRGMTSEFSGHGSVTSRVLGLRLVPAPPALAGTLGVGHGPDEVVELRRLRSLNGDPLSIENVWLPAGLCRGIMGADLSTVSLYDALVDLGVRPVRAEETVTAVTLDCDEAVLLAQPTGAGALLIERTSFDAVGRCVECVRTLIRSDRVEVRTELEPGPSTTGEQVRRTAFSVRTP